MNRRLFLAAWLAATLTGAPAWGADSAPLSSQAEAAIERLAPPECHVGVCAVDLATGEVLYAHEARKTFTPASLVKLLTSGAALSYLGAQRRFQTRLLLDRPIAGGVAPGALYMRGEGDPMLTLADLEALAAKLRAQGLKTVKGDLVADASYFQPDGPGAPGWSWDDLDEDYGAPVSALAIERNAAVVTVSPGAAPGKPLRLSVSPASAYLEVRAGATTAPAGAPAPLALETLRPGAWKEQWRLTGTLSVGAAPVQLGHAIAEPARLAAMALKEALERQGIQVQGSVRLGTTPTSARTVAAHQSPPLAEIVRVMNKESDNMIAETLLYHVGVRGQGLPGTRDKGLRTLKTFLERAGWAADTYRLEDGSGLSTYDRLTPQQLTTLLRAMAADPLAYPPYLISLPVAGVDGTLANRLGEPALRGRLRGKTGTMSAASGLAGYLTTDSGRTLAVAILVNGHLGPAAPARLLQDHLIQLFAADGSPASN